MTKPVLHQITLSSPEATVAIAKAMAGLLVPGDTLLLEGPIGAGKTHFARALIQQRLKAAGLMEDVPSPTFTLVQTYWDGSTEIWHADLYRLTGTADTLELGLDDAFDTAICLIEWPDRLGTQAPDSALELSFETGTSEVRHLKIRGGDRWSDRLKALGTFAETARA